jgi:hypothetical protein
MSSPVVPGSSASGNRGSSSRRVNLNLSEQAYSDLQSLCKGTNRTMTEVIRLGLGLVKIAITEAGSGNKLVVASERGKPLKEIVLPS